MLSIECLDTNSFLTIIASESMLKLQAASFLRDILLLVKICAIANGLSPRSDFPPFGCHSLTMLY